LFDFRVIVMNSAPLDAMKMTQTTDCGNADRPMASVVKGKINETMPYLFRALIE